MHVDFLTSPETLKLWAGFPLKERSKLFHRKFPNKRIAVTSLRRLYSTHRIKRKIVRQEKVKPSHVMQNFDYKRRELIKLIDQAKREGRKLMFLDEINFTKRSFMSLDYSVKGKNQQVDQERIY